MWQFLRRHHCWGSKPTTRKPAAILFILISSVFNRPAAALAANQTWSGGSATNGNWSSPANWIGLAPPGSTSILTSSDVATFNAPIANTWGSAVGNPIVIDSATQNIGGITFTAATDNYFIGGSVGGSGPGGNARSCFPTAARFRLHRILRPPMRSKRSMPRW